MKIGELEALLQEAYEGVVEEDAPTGQEAMDAILKAIGDVVLEQDGEAWTIDTEQCTADMLAARARYADGERSELHFFGEAEEQEIVVVSLGLITEHAPDGDEVIAVRLCLYFDLSPDDWSMLTEAQQGPTTEIADIIAEELADAWGQVGSLPLLAIQREPFGPY